MLARLHGAHHHHFVKRRGCNNIHQVDLRIGQHLLEIVIYLGNLPLTGNLLQVIVLGTNGGQLHILHTKLPV